MSVFLIDYENVHGAGLLGVDRLTENDRVYIFYSANSNSINFEAYKLLKASRAEIIPLLASCGMKNALDFQLASFMGYLAGVSKDRDLFVISLDKGYSFVQTFWEKTMQCTNFNIRFAPHIKKCLAPETIGVIDTEITDCAVFGTRQQGMPINPVSLPAAPAGEDMPGNLVSPVKPDLTEEMADVCKENTVVVHEDIVPKITAAVNEQTVPEGISVVHSSENIIPEDSAPAAGNEPVPHTESIKKAEKAVLNTPETVSESITAYVTQESERPGTMPAANKPEVSASEEDENAAVTKTALPSQLETDAAAVIEAAGIDRESTGIICGLVMYSKDKQQFYTGMTKAFGMEAGIRIYTSLKSEYANLKKLLGADGNARQSEAPAHAQKEKKAAGGRKKADTAGVKQGKSQITAIVNKTGVQNVQTNVICDLVTASKDKQQFYTGMTKTFGMEKGLKIYKSLKPEYLNLKKLLQTT